VKIFRIVGVIAVLTLLGIAQTIPATPTFICRGTWTVRPQSFIYFAFQPGTAAMVAGNFQASGGSGNDIQVLIGPHDDVLNALNGHGGTVSYDSGKQTAGTIKVRVSAGDYLIAFNNNYSSVSEKVVSANVRFTPLQQ
jgi:hypothetical protein